MSPHLRELVFPGGLILTRIILADLKGRGGYVNKDTVAGGYGSRFQGHSFTTRCEKNLRRVLQNLPSIHLGYLASIFANAGHKVLVTRGDEPIDGDIAIVLTSLVDYRHEREWAEAMQRRGTKEPSNVTVREARGAAVRWKITSTCSRFDPAPMPPS